MYYGTEEGLAGSGAANEAVREALWGKSGAFDETDPFYLALRGHRAIRAEIQQLRYGRQYFRPVSGDRRNFGLSNFAPGVLAFSRILSDTESVIVANTDLGGRAGSLGSRRRGPQPRPGARFSTMYSSVGNNRTCMVEEISNAAVSRNGASHGSVHAIRVALAPGELSSSPDQSSEVHREPVGRPSWRSSRVSLPSFPSSTRLGRCPERAGAHRGDGFVQRRENPSLADRGGDAVPVHVGLEVGTDPREDDADF